MSSIPTDPRMSESAIPMRSAGRTGLMENRMCDRNCERSRIAQMARAHNRSKPVDQVEIIDAVGGLERQQSSRRMEKRARESVLRVAVEARVIYARHSRVRLQIARKL